MRQYGNGVGSMVGPGNAALLDSKSLKDFLSLDHDRVWLVSPPSYTYLLERQS